MGNTLALPDFRVDGRLSYIPLASDFNALGPRRQPHPTPSSFLRPDSQSAP
jgi:hypothetical protein